MKVLGVCERIGKAQTRYQHHEALLCSSKVGDGPLESMRKSCEREMTTPRHPFTLAEICRTYYLRLFNSILRPFATISQPDRHRNNGPQGLQTDVRFITDEGTRQNCGNEAVR
jgi:hypothetical protein